MRCIPDSALCIGEQRVTQLGAVVVLPALRRIGQQIFVAALDGLDAGLQDPLQSPRLTRFTSCSAARSRCA